MRVMNERASAVPDGLEEWVSGRLAEAGIELRGPLDLTHDRPWSKVARGETDRGAVFAKAVWEAQRHEVAATAMLAETVPDRVPEVLGADAARGWILLADAGEPLRRQPEDVERRLLPGAASRYASLQLAMAGRVEELLAAGLPDHRRLQVPLERLLDGYPTSRDDSLMGSEVRELRDLARRLPTLEEALSEGIPASIQHDDLHPGNVLVDATGITRVFDWGYVNVASPLVSLATLLADLAGSSPDLLSEQDLHGLIRAYLAPFEAATGLHLQPRVDTARLLGQVSRAVTWSRIVPWIDEEERAQFPDPVADALRAALSLDRQSRASAGNAGEVARPAVHRS